MSDFEAKTAECKHAYQVPSGPHQASAHAIKAAYRVLVSEVR
jgi:hypothetical protein